MRYIKRYEGINFDDIDEEEKENTQEYDDLIEFIKELDDKWYDSLVESIDFDDVDDEEEVFTNTRGHDEFFEFLKKHDVYTSFIHNYKDYKFDDIPLQDFLDDTDPIEFVSSAFNWVKTSSLHTWFELNNLWENIVSR